VGLRDPAHALNLGRVAFGCLKWRGPFFLQNEVMLYA